MKNNKGASCFFLLFLAVIGYLNFFEFSYRDSPIISSMIIMSFSFICFSYQLIKRGILSEIFGSVILAIIVLFIGMIPVVGQLFLIVFVVYNLIKTLKSIRSLLSSAIMSLLLYGSLFLSVFNIDPFVSYVVYLLLSIGFVMYLANEYPEKGDFLLKISTILCSIPLIVLLVSSITSTLRNLFEISPASKIGSRTINVGEYVRGDSIVSAHTRNIATTVTTLETTISASSAVTSSIAKTGAEASSEEETK